MGIHAQGCSNLLQVGKKKTQDVQFYTEVMEVNQAIDAGRRSMYDPDELEEEQRERETRNRVRPCPLGFMLNRAHHRRSAHPTS